MSVLEIEGANPATPERTEKAEFLVDSGAVCSVVPTPVLERLGIRPFLDHRFRLADGSKVPYQLSVLRCRLCVAGHFTVIDALGPKLKAYPRSMGPIPIGSKIDIGLPGTTDDERLTTDNGQLTMKGNIHDKIIYSRY